MTSCAGRQYGVPMAKEVSEEWKPVVGFEPFYEVSNQGRVRAVFKSSNFHKVGRIIKPWKLKNGYLQVHLMPPKSPKNRRCIHTLVLEAFVGKRSAGLQARHLDGNPSHNHVSNLAWGTAKENAKDRDIHGNTMRGERNGHSRLTNQAVFEIRKLLSDGFSCPTIAAIFGVDRTLPWQILKGKIWKHI